MILVYDGLSRRKLFSVARLLVGRARSIRAGSGTFNRSELTVTPSVVTFERDVKYPGFGNFLNSKWRMSEALEFQVRLIAVAFKLHNHVTDGLIYRGCLA